MPINDDKTCTAASTTYGCVGTKNSFNNPKIKLNGKMYCTWCAKRILTEEIGKGTLMTISYTTES